MAGKWYHVWPWLLRILGFGCLAFAWEVAHAFSIFDPTLLPGLSAVAKAFVKLLGSWNTVSDVGMTVVRTLAGFGLAAIAGIPLGIGMGVFRPVYLAAMPPVDFFRSIPVTTLYPVFVLLLGVGDKSKIGMIFTACVFVVMLNSAYGVLQARPTRRQMARLYGCSAPNVLRWVTFYEALPQTLIGLRISLSLSLIVAVLTEMFMGSEYGLGQLLTDAYTTFAIDRLYAIVILTGTIGFIFNRLFVRLETWLVPWSSK
ncbi:MAG TPA: ABC transporter permease [Chthoniobacterales bacterium]|nr:ABC transporter permease [Chthoniobacterales bacterium]